MTTFKIEIDCVLQTEPWLVEMSDGDDPVFTFKPDGPRHYPGLPAFEAMSREEQEKLLASPVELNPWLMRERFFKIGNVSIRCVEFLKGVWRLAIQSI